MVLYQPSNGYRYNSDTHFLFYFIKENLKKFRNIQGSLLDVGSGSGILGLLMKRDFSKLDLYGCEVQDSFLFLSQKNAQINNLKTHLYEGKFQELDFQREFDIIISNPPFYPQSVIKSENQSLRIARYNDNLPLKDFIQSVSKHLKNSGKFFFCYDVKLLDDIMRLCKEYKLNIESMQFLHPKKDKKATLVMVYARKNSKTLLDILPPLIMFEENQISDFVNDIYKMCDTYSIKVEL